MSIMVPAYVVYGVQYEYRGKEVFRHQLFFENLLPAMRGPAAVMARRIESTFGISALSRDVLATPIPLIVQLNQPPHTTLFHALFTNAPANVP
ncbi:hypothetical protein HPC49_18540 [Pyxidicoccus fallax]|uniref:Uncharacterized protein n=1 Tax=Pyxidicoccus fallax TaxID=394095 RepID=A0A848LNF3_9BACT|nr:hypothetical protein [Pyxidicoccus fallax]NMO19200.1 hypothetical protein [Pyxidicoccus fallax]NPC80209.1 hypothetical protein [Pyxidicoccus fallax]